DEQVCEVGVGDGLQQATDGGHVERGGGGAGGLQHDHVPVGQRHPATVDGRQQVGEVVGDQVHRAQLDGLGGGGRAALAHGVDREVDVAAALLGDGLDVGGGVVDDLVADLAALQPHRGGRPDVGARGHGRHVRREGDDGAGGRG